MAKRRTEGKTKVEVFAETRELEERCSISPGNSKTGELPSFSLPPFVACLKNLPCYPDCYANNHVYRINKQPHACYDDNWYTLHKNPDLIWKTIEATVMLNLAFRWHVSGEIVDMDYLQHMVDIAKRNPHCQMICFTKKYALVNDWMTINGPLPDNLHMIYSAWRGLQMNNPYHMPECHLIYKDGTTTANEDKVSFVCKGGCDQCCREHKHCFALKKDEQILINEH